MGEQQELSARRPGAGCSYDGRAAGPEDGRGVTQIGQPVLGVTGAGGREDRAHSACSASRRSVSLRHSSAIDRKTRTSGTTSAL